MIPSMPHSQSLKQPLVGLVLATALISPFYFTANWINSPRLISYDQLPPDNGDCDYDSAAAELPNLMGGMALPAGLLQQTVEQGSGGSEITPRQPVRIIRDPNSAYSAVAVDTVHNEVVLTDENLFNIITYDRQTNTPPTSVSDPQRVIGGLNTKIEFQGGV